MEKLCYNKHGDEDEICIQRRRQEGNIRSPQEHTR